MTRFRIGRAAAAVLALAIFAVAGALAVSADAPAPTPAPQAGPAPPGLDSLMPPPAGIQQGNAATLEERYPALAYANFNVDTLNTISNGFQDPTGTAANVLANWWAGELMTLVTAVAIVTIRLVEWTFSLDLASGAGAPLSAAVQTVHDQLFIPLLPIALALLGLALTWVILARRRSLQGLTNAGWALAVLVVASVYFAAPAAVLGAVDGFAGDLSRGILASIGAGDPGMVTRATDSSFSQGDPADAELRMFADRYWRTFVFQPWSVATFGDPATGQRFGEELLAKQSNMPSNFDLDFNNPINGPSDQAKAWYNGQYGGFRLGIAALTLVAVVLASVLCLLVAGTVLMSQLALVLLAMVLPLFLLVGLHPGIGRRILVRLAEMAAGALMMRVLSAAFLAVLLVVSGLLDQTVSAVAGGWLVASALQVALLAAAFVYRKPFLRVFGQVASPRLARGPAGSAGVARKAHTGLDWVAQRIQHRGRQAVRPGPGGAAQTVGKAAAKRGTAAAVKGAAGAAKTIHPAGLALLAVEAGKLGVRWAARGTRAAQGAAGSLVQGASTTPPRPAFSGSAWRRLPLRVPAPPPPPSRAEPNGGEPKPKQPPPRTRTSTKAPVGRTYTNRAGETVSLRSRRIILTDRWRETKP
jgi:hypothetical protein